MGGDSAAIAGLELAVYKGSKVFRSGAYLFGYSGSFRMGQLLAHAFVPPDPPPRGLNKFMVTHFVEELRAVFHDAAFVRRREHLPGNILVGVQGTLFQLERDWQIGEDAASCDAIGCGADLARGALYATKGLLEPRKRVLTALVAAEKGSAGVRAPFTVLKLGNPK